jgi:hypothetical protein
MFFWIQLVRGPQRTSYLGFYAVRRRSLGLERQVVELGNQSSVAKPDNATNGQRKFQRQENRVASLEPWHFNLNFRKP